MDTSKLKKFAQYARRSLIEQVQSKLKLVLAEDSAARREYPQALKELEAKQKEFGDDQQLIEQVAYTWFNRFCALRFMDANQYNRIMVVSPIAGQFQPEILAEAKAGHLDESVFDAKTSDKVQGLLSGSVPSRDGQAEAYRLIIVAICNAYHRLMPYLFERIEDYTELLMPEDLLSGNSILAYTREAMTPENCESVESIGWLYQFYISEKKDQVFEGLKKNKKITPENIPAATQLFTPHWIVKYLVENSLGRLWMLNNPSSKVIEQMEYYIKPVEEEEDFLKISSPEELKICDPAAGSGHMLTYAYDLLYAIYLDANYDPVDIPELILTKNLYGIEIDERAGELAAFALSMKAMKGNPCDDSNNRRRFFRNPIEPNICRLEKVTIDEEALEDYIEFAGKELFTSDVRATLKEFEEADNFGSLIKPTLKEPTELLEKLESKDAQVDLFFKDTHESILKILKQAKYLSSTYKVVTANPPYLGSKGMNGRLSVFAKENYPFSKSDLFAMFVERCSSLTIPNGFTAMITMHSWMFLSSLEKLRANILRKQTISTLAHLGTRGFDSIGGEVVSTVAFVLQNRSNPNYKGTYINLVEGKSEYEKNEMYLASINQTSKNQFQSKTIDFKKISGSPIAYWLSQNSFNIFESWGTLGDAVKPRQGMSTNDNQRFLRRWFEVSSDNTHYCADSAKDAQNSGAKWFPYNKGGDFRKWRGNDEYLVNWFNDGEEIKQWLINNPQDPNTTSWSRRIINTEFYFKEGLTWSFVGGAAFGIRYTPVGRLFDVGGSSMFPSQNEVLPMLSYLCSKVAFYFLKVLNPTLNFQTGNLAALPWDSSRLAPYFSEVSDKARHLIKLYEEDWNTAETSWGFKKLDLMKNIGGRTIQESIESVISMYDENVKKAKMLEEEINRLFISAFNFDEELDEKVDKSNISLLTNMYYKKNIESENHTNIRLNQVKELTTAFISYSVGCIFGRYSMDREGLILSSSNSSIEQYYELVPNPSYRPDTDNVIPLIDFEGDWFEDDISERFKEFLKVTFGEEKFTENLAFIEETIGKDIRKYFVKDFYADHVKRYKKRPIYWMFSSPRGSFNALIYMHRYQPDTVSIVLNDYLREFRTKLEARKESYEQVEISASASLKDKTNAIKAIAKINKVLEEINDYEHEVLYPLAGEKIEIDLDDGVKHNYPLFGKALKKVPGLS